MSLMRKVLPILGDRVLKMIFRAGIGVARVEEVVDTASNWKRFRRGVV